MVSTVTHPFRLLPPRGRERLLALGRPVRFPAGTRIFREGRHADRFWVIRSGTVTLDLHVAGRRPAHIETLHPGDLLGWSWMVPPYTWRLGAQAAGDVSALEFDAAAVRGVCDDDPELGRALAVQVAEIIGRRLQRTRTRLLDLYAPYGSGP
ncbi:cyclic nucleotide-binding domain-containing protein [Streptomyces sp. GSL17-111]|uniref:cyclic nucleotide-binding domain-containing protein n=1 Tax=Streptomyces sp. GSL17-111 TaxID=3121596 RepID=UPI0030F4529C